MKSKNDNMPRHFDSHRFLLQQISFHFREGTDKQVVTVPS